MKKKNLLFLMLTFVLYFMFSLAGCDKVDETKKGDPVVPTYQSMTITKESMINNVKNSAKSSSIGSIKLLSSTTNNEVSSTDIHSEDDETLENDIEDIVTIDVITDDEIKYYVQPNEVFIINVHISNPYDYEIQSFTLNGKKYANYMFKEGSTMESLLLEVTAPSTSGYVEYTIDAIKYIDGTEIKDVDMSSGDKSIKAGIAFLNAPSAFITSQNISTTYIDLGINISDSENLIKDNELSIYLSDGQNVVDKKTLKVGANNIHFDNLTMSTLYEYGIVTAYDLVDGRDTHSDWLLTNTFTTLGAFKISDVNVNKTSISFNVARTGEVGNITSISLYDANTKELIKSGNADIRNFNDLLSNHTYNIYVDFEYTLNGEKVSDWVSYKDVTTVAKVKPTLSFDSSSSDKTSISYNVSTEDTDGILNITKVELLKNNESVKDNGSLLSGSFDGLLSNNKYSVKVSYTYDLNDGQGTISDFITKDVTTVAKVKPTLSFDSSSSDKTSISYNVSTEDTDGILNITKVELLKNNESVKDNGSLLSGSFDGLLSNNKYSVKVSYTYDLNDGQGTISDFITKDVTTVAKVKPTLSISNDEVTDTSINALLTMNDEDSIGNIDSVKILKNDIVVATNNAKEISFNSLDYYTDYKVVIEYSYDLNDGLGIQNEKIEKEYKTSPHLVFNSCKIINTSAVSEGETIYMQVSLGNPSGALPSSVVVNGETYNCSGSTTPNKLYVEIVNNGQFEGGNTTLTIERVNMTLDSNNYSIEPSSNNSGSIFINGQLVIKSLYFTNANYEKIDWAYKDDSIGVVVELENKSGYEINEICLDKSYTSFVKINDNKFYIPSVTSNQVSLRSLSYSNEFLSKTITPDHLNTNYIYRVNSGIVEISTYEQLKNMNGNNYYVLTNDIDLSGIEWTNPGNFSGVFNGNNHKIINMTNVSSFADTNVSLGLFSSGSGYIYDLKIVDTLFMITLNSTGSNYQCNIGGFVADVSKGHLSFDNCSFTGDISVVNNSPEDYGFSGSTCIGGFAGLGWPYPSYLSINNCISNANISSKNSSGKYIGCAGSFVGYYAWASLECYVTNCQASGNINAGKADAIGVIRESSNVSIIKIINCITDVYVNGKRILKYEDKIIYDL